MSSSSSSATTPAGERPTKRAKVSPSSTVEGVEIPAMSAEMLSEMLSSEGPIVKAVVLRATGEAEELSFDSTPAKNEASMILGGSATFVGQFPAVNVIVMRLRDAGSATPVSKHSAALAPPLHALEAPVRGDMLLVRMDDEGEPADFTLSEYTAFKASDHSEALADYAASEKAEAEAKAAEEAKAAAGDGEEVDDEEEEEEEEEEDGEYDEDEEEDDDDDDEGDLSPEQEALLMRVIGGFQSEHGREPTQDEVVEIMGKLNALMQMQDAAAAAEEDAVAEE
jgi:hypothetical protein